MSEKDWKWFGNAGHFICSDSCRFHLTTQVGKYLISTVGEYLPKGIPTKQFESVGSDPDELFETMVFEIGGYCYCGCGLPLIGDVTEPLDIKRYKTPGEANQGHLKFCKKYDGVI
jgi:hypothetical protein